MRWLYQIAMVALLPFALLHLAWRGRRQTRGTDAWRERLAHVPVREDAPLWVHAASVGEVQAAVPLIRALLNRAPDLPILITTFTAAGRRRAEEALGDSISYLTAPYDLPWIVSRFLRRVRPRMLLVMETELWLNLFERTHARRIPLVMASARLSERSADRYLRVRGLTRRILGCASLICAQTAADAERFKQVGAEPDRVVVTGNVKFDLTIPGHAGEEAEALRRMLFGGRSVWIAASTHPGEEEKVLDAHEQILTERPDALLVLVPRHPDRASAVASLVRNRGFGLVRRSAMQPCTPETGVFLVDTLGELVTFYAAADVAFVGGSLVPIGGHNLLEPAALGVATLTGPYNDNAADIAERLIQAGAVRQVHNAAQLARTVLELMENPERRARLGEAGRSAVEANRGGVARLIEFLESWLDLGEGP